MNLAASITIGLDAARRLVVKAAATIWIAGTGALLHLDTLR